MTRSRLSGLPAGPRAKWVVLAVWLLAAAALGPLQPRLQARAPDALGELVHFEAPAEGGSTARTGVVVGLERTGAVITSAGLILAGTFLVLTLLPLEQLFQLGFAVALGVLVDTFVVRSLLVPAIALLLGDRSWWPWHLR